MRSLIVSLLLFVLLSSGISAQDRRSLPIIDVHLHSRSLERIREQGPNPISGAAALESVEEHVRQTLAALKEHNVVLGIVSGSLDGVEQFRRAAPDRIWAAPDFSLPDLDVEELRRGYASGRLAVMGEVDPQYEGLSPSDSAFEPYWALAEEFDIPVGIHTGVSYPGVTTLFPNFRVGMGNPLVLEELLNRHPDLRVYIMHGGWPFVGETMGILHVYPRVYIDISAIVWALPRDEFRAYLEQIIGAGFGDRIMFGSDQVSWPDMIGLAIDVIESADFLTDKQKRDILYNNAARFLRLTPDEIARHHGESQPVQDGGAASGPNGG